MRWRKRAQKRNHQNALEVVQSLSHVPARVPVPGHKPVKPMQSPLKKPLRQRPQLRLVLPISLQRRPMVRTLKHSSKRGLLVMQWVRLPSWALLIHVYITELCIFVSGLTPWMSNGKFSAFLKERGVTYDTSKKEINKTFAFVKFKVSTNQYTRRMLTSTTHGAHPMRCIHCT